jgi:hypothetical protein
MCPLQAPVIQGFFFAAALNSTNETNKAGGIISLQYLDVYGSSHIQLQNIYFNSRRNQRRQVTKVDWLGKVGRPS